MFPEYKKITVGFVVQTYITLPNGTSVCQNQEFIAGDQVDYTNLDGAPVGVGEIDVTKEVYCPFEMKAPKQIPDEKDAVKFVCPICGDTRLEVVLDGSHTTALEAMFKSGAVEYGDTESNGYVDRFQCQKCGFTIQDVSGPITDDEELVGWCKENCNQE